MPNSILWIGLVILWVFVLFPLLAARYPRIRRTTDTALATRVLHRGGTKRRTKPGPASGHDSDPDWVPRRVQRKLFHGDDAEDRMTTSADEPVTEHDDSGGSSGVGGVQGTADAGEVIEAEVDFDDAEFAGDDAVGDAGIEDAEIADVAENTMVEESDEIAGDEGSAGEDPAGSGADGEAEEFEAAPMTARIPPARSASRLRRAARLPEPEPDEPELDEPESPTAESGDDEAEPDSDDDSMPGRFVPSRRGRGGYDPEADAVARAARYRFRQRTTLGLALSALLFGAFAVAVTPMLWWGCGLSAVVLVGYLIYLRRQVRLEEEIRRRRTARLARGPRPPAAAPATEQGPTAASVDREMVTDLRRRAVVLDVDDEDPAFDFLETFDAAAARATRTRAGGGEIRRAAGE